MTYGFAPIQKSTPPFFPKPIHFNGSARENTGLNNLRFTSNKLSLSNDMFVKNGTPRQDFYPTPTPIPAVQAIASNNGVLGKNLNTYG